MPTTIERVSSQAAPAGAARTCLRCGEENGERARFCSSCGVALAEAGDQAVGERKTVTILFSDVTGSTSLGERLDPESLREVMAGYFEAGRSVVERHGGTVAKFIGDAVMAVFGVPHVHEDDALRGVRAALELHERVEQLNDELERRFGVRLALRSGVTTGEVFVGPGEVFATGDAVNVAARLEQAAAPGEVLVGEPTRRLVGDAVEFEPLAPMELKGKGDLVAVWRALGLAQARRTQDAPSASLVGRDHELGALRAAHAATAGAGRCELVTLVGPAGIGKSRLVRELAGSGHARGRVYTGRCLPYGEGITFWPLAEIVREAAGIDAGMSALEGLGRVRSLVGADPDADVIAERLAGAIGLAGGPAPPEEILWAFRRLFVALAAGAPAIVVLEDIHWAEPTLLDLVERLAESVRDAAVLLVCCARPELLDVRPRWGDQASATTLVLAPLSSVETRRFVDSLAAEVPVAPALRERVGAVSGGNPLFAAEMLALLAERGGVEGEVVLPPTIQALLAARLDRLAPDERALLARAAVVGERFSTAALRELGAGEDVLPMLDALVRKELVAAGSSAVGAPDFRFSHLLLRDAAYSTVPKAVRADLHERYALFLAGESGERVAEVEAIVGYHLEQAYRNRLELGPEDAVARTLADEAAARLHAAGTRASARGDLPAALSLLERAHVLSAPDAPVRAAIGADLGGTLLDLWQVERAVEALAAAEALARSTGQRVVELSVQVMLTKARAQSDPHFDMGAGVTAVTAAIAELEREDADRALAQAWRMLGFFHLVGHRLGPLEEAASSWLEHARRAGGAGAQADALFWLTLGVAYGPSPVDEALRRCKRMLGDAAGPPAKAAVMHAVAALRAMAGDADEGLAMMRRVRASLRELGLVTHAEGAAYTEAMVALHGGDSDGAERTLEAAIETLEQRGEAAYFSLLLGLLAAIRARRGDPEEVLRLSDRCREVAVMRLSQAYWRAARALALARQGHAAEAMLLAHEAIAVLGDADDTHTRGWLLRLVADVFDLGGDHDAARAALREAEALLTHKGCVVCAAEARTRIAALEARTGLPGQSGPHRSRAESRESGGRAHRPPPGTA